MQNLFQPNPQTDESLFTQGVLSLGDRAYATGCDWWWKGRDRHHAPRIMWMLASLKKGDLIVGIEGTRVRGICEVQTNGFDSYQDQIYYKNDGSKSEYANTFGGKVQWFDWCPYRLGKAPTTPAKSVRGIAGLWKERNHVLNAWKTIQHLTANNRSWYPIWKIEETLRIHDSLMDGLICYSDDSDDKKVFFKHGDGRSGYFIKFGNVVSRKWILEDIEGNHPAIEFSSIEDMVRTGWVLD